MIDCAKVLGIPFYSCFAHVLNLIIVRTLRELKLDVNSPDDDQTFSSLISKCRSIVSLFNHSTGMNKELKDAQINNNSGTKPIRLIQDVVTRWNSLYKMLERLIKLNGAVTTVLSLNRYSEYVERILTNEEVLTLTQIAAVLKPFYLVTEKLIGEKYFTRSIICPSIVKLYSFKKEKSEDSEFTCNFKKQLLNDMTFYFEKYNFIEKSTSEEIVCIVEHLTSTLIDPKYKKFTCLDDSTNKKDIYKIVARTIEEAVNPIASGEIGRRKT